jgi:hypothetical protein
MKQKPMTKREVQKLIRQISKATGDEKYGEQFMNLLSAMRGPDFADPKLEIKRSTTTIIRNRLGWQCGMMDDDGRSLDNVCLSAGQTPSPHFRDHILWAVRALRTFGFDKYPGQRSGPVF